MDPSSMRLYSDRGRSAPSPRRVRMYLAEKGLDVPLVELVLHEENRTPEFRKKNRVQTLPVLELPDGSHLAESMAICRYFEELFPEPPLFGRDARERAHIEMWSRRAEWYLYLPIDFSGDFLGAETGAKFRAFAEQGLRFADRRLGEARFLAGEAFSMADIFAFGAIDYGIQSLGFRIPEERRALQAWFDKIAARPSAKA